MKNLTKINKISWAMIFFTAIILASGFFVQKADAGTFTQGGWTYIDHNGTFFNTYMGSPIVWSGNGYGGPDALSYCGAGYDITSQSALSDGKLAGSMSTTIWTEWRYQCTKKPPLPILKVTCTGASNGQTVSWNASVVATNSTGGAVDSSGATYKWQDNKTGKSESIPLSSYNGQATGINNVTVSLSGASATQKCIAPYLKSPLSDQSVDYSNNYSIGNFQLNGYTNTQGVTVLAALFEVDVQAGGSDVPFYKNVAILNSAGKSGDTSISGISTGVVDSGDHYTIPAGTKGVINVQSVFNSTDLPNGKSDVNIYFPTSIFDTAPVPQKINGVCGKPLNSCSAGAFEFANDTLTKYNWKCDGVNGGSTATCNLPIPPVNFGLCGFVNNECLSGTLVDTPDSATDYLWTCQAPNKGTDNASCDLSKTATSTNVSTPAKTAKLTVKTGATCGGQEDIVWNFVTGATSYNLYRSTATNGVFTLLQSGIITTSYTDLSGQGKFFYKVTAVNGGVESVQSTAASAAASKECKSGTVTPVASSTSMTVPSILAKLAVKTGATCGGQTTLSWNPVSGALSYNIFRSDSATGAYTQISNVTTNSYTDTPGQGKFFYKVATSFDGGINSTQSASVTAAASKQCKADVPATPAVTAGSCGGQINVSWAPSTNADSYNVYRAKTATGGYSQIAKGITATTYTDTDDLMIATKQTTKVNGKNVTTTITNPGTFYYKISATNSVGTTAQSPSASATASGVCSVSINGPIQPQVAQNSFLKGMLGNAWSAFSSLFK